MIQQIYTQTASIVKPSFKEVPEKFRESLSDLFDTWNSVLARNKELTTYYNMKQELKDLGISIPENFVRVNCAMGWCKKALDAYTVRSTFDGFAFAGATDESLNWLVRENRLHSLYKMAVRASLIHGLSAMTVMKGTGSQPAAKVRAYSAHQFSALWDKDEGRIACGIVLADTDMKGNPIKFVAHYPDAVLILTRQGDEHSNEWSCDVLDNDLGRPCMELMPYDADLDRPLGHSMITPELQAIVDKAMRDVFRMDIGAEFFTFPQRYILGAADDLFSEPTSEQQSGFDIEGNEGDEEPRVSSDHAKLKAYIGAILAISRDENGDIPSVGEFSATPAQNFTHMFENDAQRFSGATNVPLAQLGVLSNTYTSSDALNATNDPLILKVEDLNLDNTLFMQEIARMMMAINEEKPINKLSDAQKRVQAVFLDPARLTFSARADGWTKMAAADKSIIGTDVWYEGMGLQQAKIDRLQSQKDRNSAIEALNAIADSMELPNDRA